MAKRANVAQPSEGRHAAGNPQAEDGRGEALARAALTAKPSELDVSLSLRDMMRDANGEVVLFNDSNLRSLTLLTNAQRTGQGQAKSHVTASGADVTGYRYISFDDGTTLYFHPDLEIVVRNEAG